MKALAITETGFLILRSGINVFAVHPARLRGKNLEEIASWLSHDIRKTLGKEKVENEEIIKEYSYLNIKYIFK